MADSAAKGSAKSCTWEEKTQYISTCWKQNCKMDWREETTESRLDVCQLCALLTKKATSILGCIRGSLERRSKEMILPFSPMLRPPLECCVSGLQNCWTLISISTCEEPHRG